MTRSLWVWTALLGMPGALACNLILGNEIPDVLRAQAPSSTSSSSGTNGEVDAESPLDAGPDATDDHAELPAAQLVFVNGNPVGAFSATDAPPFVTYVLREDQPTWTPFVGPNSHLASPAVFYEAPHLYVIGGQLTVTITQLATFPAFRAIIDDAATLQWENTTALPNGHPPSRCVARVSDAVAPSVVEVLCGVARRDGGVEPEKYPGVVAYRRVRTGDAQHWVSSPYPPLAANGAMYSTRDALVGVSKSDHPDEDAGGVQWTSTEGFQNRSRHGLPKLVDACATSFAGRAYVVLTDPATRSLSAYVEDAERWNEVPGLHDAQEYFEDLTCTATERGLYVAGAVTQIVRGEPVRTSKLLRALATDPNKSHFERWDNVVAAPPEHAPGAVLIAVPRSAGDAGK